ncbi:hypothetical protein EAE99_012353 [Botrytis elliptica]|nr:hypothetical protein EAE99_012353 [Botrytis elliptica]
MYSYITIPIFPINCDGWKILENITNIDHYYFRSERLIRNKANSEFAQSDFRTRSFQYPCCRITAYRDPSWSFLMANDPKSWHHFRPTNMSRLNFITPPKILPGRKLSTTVISAHKIPQFLSSGRDPSLTASLILIGETYKLSSDQMAQVHHSDPADVSRFF